MATTMMNSLPAAMDRLRRPGSDAGVLTRIFRAMQAARLNEAERQIAAFGRLYGPFTDETEREIERRFLRGGL